MSRTRNIHLFGFALVLIVIFGVSGSQLVLPAQGQGYPLAPEFCSEVGLTRLADLSETDVDLGLVPPEGYEQRALQYFNPSGQEFVITVSSPSPGAIDEYLNEAAVCFEAMFVDEEQQAQHFAALEMEMLNEEAAFQGMPGSPYDTLLASIAEVMGIDEAQLRADLDAGIPLQEIIEGMGYDFFEVLSQALEVAYRRYADAGIDDPELLEELETVYGLILEGVPPTLETAVRVAVEAIVLDGDRQPIEEPYLLFYFVDPALPKGAVDEYGPINVTGATMRTCVNNGRVSARLALNGTLQTATEVTTTSGCRNRTSSSNGKFCGIVTGMNNSNTYAISGSFGIKNYSDSRPPANSRCP